MCPKTDKRAESHDEMALKKRWGKMPLVELEKRLNEITKGRVLRIDKGVPPELAG
jgi:hypothetical protein